eukprot:gene739-1041_t
MPVSLHFSRAEESMLVRSGPSCIMRFQVETVPGDALYPVPGEGGKSMSSVVLLLVPALLVPCLCVGLIMALGRLAPVTLLLLQDARVAMSRRARARRMRRHIRPVYVGPGAAPGAVPGAATGQQLALGGQVKPGGVSLVAPYF